MAAPRSVDQMQLLEVHLATASPGLLREMIASVANAMMSAQADQLGDAEYGQRSGERVNRRSGYRTRDWDIRMGTVVLVVPKLREGYYPDWLCAGRLDPAGGAPSRAARVKSRSRWLVSAVLRAEYLHHPPLVEGAFGKQTLALLRPLNVACSNADELAAATVTHFDTHPDVETITSLPGLGSLTGARVLAGIGDDRSHFTNARSLKAYAGAAPVTRASGKSLTVTHRRVKNQRLAAVGYVWAFAALTASPGARAHYDRRKTTGDRHTAAQRNVLNRLLGCLHHCLQTRQHYNENIAFPP